MLFFCVYTLDTKLLRAFIFMLERDLFGEMDNHNEDVHSLLIKIGTYYSVKWNVHKIM